MSDKRESILETVRKYMGAEPEPVMVPGTPPAPEPAPEPAPRGEILSRESLEKAIQDPFTADSPLLDADTYEQEFVVLEEGDNIEKVAGALLKMGAFGRSIMKEGKGRDVDPAEVAGLAKIIMDINKIKDPTKLQLGQEIILPPVGARTHGYLPPEELKIKVRTMPTQDRDVALRVIGENLLDGFSRVPDHSSYIRYRLMDILRRPERQDILPDILRGIFTAFPQEGEDPLNPPPEIEGLVEALERGDAEAARRLMDVVWKRRHRTSGAD